MRIYEQVMLRFLWEEAPIVALLVDGEGLIREANVHACKLLGGAVLGRRFRDIIVMGEGASPGAEGGLARLPDRVHLILDGEGVDTYRITAFAVDDSNLVLGIADDQDRAFAASEVAKLNDEIHNLARELARKNAELARLDQLKNRFLGMAAHDLRKPVGALLAYAEILIDEAGPALEDDHRRYLGTIQSSCGFMAQLIDDFLDVATIESGRLEIRRAPTNPAAVIRESLVLATVHASRRGVALEADAPDLPPIPVDPSKMEQVVNNLVINAIDHSPKGERVTVTSKVADGRWTIVVTDRGPGIQAEDLGKIFNPFERGNQRRSAARKSTGLGLAISRKIVEGHGGTLAVESKPGDGATFAVTIPVEDRSEP